ncbi:probable serine/threonine-protein kinase DDB_G0282963 isoform X1 [Diabrotica virgifera virgifera]|uniref:Chitin-binding type-2 domain-containing protein n=1 Tax=Diabrotica virgifera virgifera TaxID=50390 RepID=A0ABM5L9J0_DIAVI|nr:probable serine/threonine-protein kinase DDB_G0282963 isoform X1 [Diabrotica virgifera virgifera]
MVHSVAIFVILCFGTILAERRFRNAPIATSVKTGVNFDCPEEFGYYPHPSDCTQYYVCVFGGALLESCTGGLMYSHELQTCDWPRNVGCDGLDVSVSGAPASYSSYSPPARSKDRGREREKDKEREDTRPRYSAPPPPPPPLVQPAAVVTSRGQPRNLQQTQQEIIKRKQQQQLYVEAEEALPPAEEIESDRQQRVYRGQPSTIGQVQRDRDGLRHSNAISSYSGRGEKIGVISFGTQNQHYRLMTDDDLLLKYITPKRRQKRQIPKSRPPETTHHTRRQGNEKHFLDFIQFQPLTEQPRYTKRFSFNPSAPISNKEDDFHPFTPSYQKNSNNYQYIAFGKWADIPSRTSTIRYVNSYTTPNPASDKKRNRFPIKYNTSPVLVLQGDYSQTEAQKVPYVISHKPGNLQTQAIVAPYEVTTDSNENIQANTTEESSVEELEQFEPPPEFYKTENPYAHITNPFADPNFDFDEFLKRFQDLMTSTENSVVSTITSTESTTLKSKLSETTTSPSSHKHSGLNLIDLKVDENRKNENKRNNHRVHYTNTDLDKRYLGNDTRGNHPKNYSNILNINYIKENSSHQNVKPAKVEDPQQPKIHPVVDKTQVNDSSNDYYYYYDTYEDDPYPDKDGIRNNKDYIYYYDDEYYYPDFNSERKNSTSETVKSNEKVKVIVSDSKLNTQGSTVSPTVKVNLPYQKSRKTTLYRNTTTTPRPNRTTRRYSTRPTKRLVKRPEENVKQRIPFKELYDNETKSQRGEGFKSEEKPVSPQQASVSAVAAPARNIYNGSQYSDNRYEPYYSLYEDDVEIYRDEYPANENTYNNENSPSTAYRGTAPVSTVTPSSIRNEIPRRGNTVYIENNINPQDIYQQSTVSDYNENNNKYETQDDQNSYKQNNRQQSYRGDRNELNDVEEVATKRTTTKRTTTTTRKPSTTTRVTSTTTTIPPPKSSQPPQSARPEKSIQNHSLAETAENTDHFYDTYDPYPPSYYNDPDINHKENITFVVLDSYDDLYPQYYTVNKIPANPKQTDIEPSSTTISVTTSTSKSRPNFHYITKPSIITTTPRNTPHPTTESSTTTTTTTTSTTPRTTITSTTTVPISTPETELEQLSRSSSVNKRPSAAQIIIPTTYLPFRFVLKAPISKAVVVDTTPISNTWKSNSTASVHQNINNSSRAFKTLKAVRKVLNPVSLNHELSASAEEAKNLAKNLKEEVDTPVRLKFFVSEHRISNEKFVPTSRVQNRLQNQLRKTSSTTQRISTVSTTVSTTPKSVKTTEEPFEEPELSDEEYITDSIENYDSKSTELTSTEDENDTKLPKPNSLPTQEPKPFSKPVITSTATTNFLQNDSLPTRTSRVNAAIKSLINLGETRGSSKYKEGLIFPSKNYSKQRTPSRGRGSVQYSGAGDQITNNEVIVTNNRGTPPTRSRPTLKPSTSIVSKAQEFVDVYKYPPTRPDPIYPQPQVDKTAAKCRKDVCLLPDCSCGGKDIPGDLPVEQIPQIVLLTFDDSVNDLNKGLYQDLFEKGRTNPNGCPISATFYVSHEWTDYSQVQNLYSDGHELASHTVSHSFGEQFSQKKWTREVAGQREILAAYGGVHLEDVRGMRAPFLSVGGNKMFKMLYDSNFTYDSSLPVYENKPPSWPYTLDYKLFHDCMIPPCPTRSYPGVWEVPMVMWQDLNGGRCSMGDACSNPPDADGVFKMLTKNFMRHYTTNRAPFGLFYHAAWFTQPHHKEGFINFIDSILAKNDVWFLTNWQAIQWVRDPTPMSRIGSFQPFQCNYQNRPKRCNNPKVCNLWHKSGVRYMRTCQPCPDIYPWTGNTGIRSSKIDNDIGD